MVRTHVRGPLGLLAVACALATAGWLLMASGTDPSSGVRPPSPAPAAASSAAPAPGLDSRTSRRPAASASLPSTETAVSGGRGGKLPQLPPPVEGPAGDPAVQQALEDTSPRDLPLADEEQLLRSGREVLTAEVTGHGREKWNDYFEDGAPFHLYRRVRVQAAIARREHGSPHAAVVHVVWAGTDHGGTHRAGRTASVRFVTTPDRTRGEQTWTPAR